MSTESLPQPWNEESEAGIKRLIEERDRARELAGKKTAEAEDNLVRAVLAERENARLQEELEKVRIVEIPDLNPDGHANRMFVDGYKFAQKRARSVPAMELLEALEGVEPYLEEDPDDDGDYNERVRAVHAAIAKVRRKS